MRPLAIGLFALLALAGPAHAQVRFGRMTRTAFTAYARSWAAGVSGGRLTSETGARISLRRLVVDVTSCTLTIELGERPPGEPTHRTRYSARLDAILAPERPDDAPRSVRVRARGSALADGAGASVPELLVPFAGVGDARTFVSILGRASELCALTDPAP